MNDTMPDTDPIPVLSDPCAHCTLAEARAGERFTVMAVNDDRARVTALRFGIAEGACVQCVARIPAGPIVLKSGRQEIAVGRELAKRITVRHLTEAGETGTSGRR
jgi:Fe2+ transport system protein FeoA